MPAAAELWQLPNSRSRQTNEREPAGVMTVVIASQPKPPYDELVAAWKGLRRTHGLRVREVACVGAPRTLLVVERGPDNAPPIALSAGMHGDEPAAPWALLSLVSDRLLDDRFAYRIWPCINPTGYTAGTRANAEGHDINRSFSRGGLTPESRAIITANRDRRFNMSIDLHEDFEAEGFYGFESHAPGGDPRYAAGAVAAIEAAGLPIQDLADINFDLGSPPEARACQTIGHGTVSVDAIEESKYFPAGLPMSLFLVRRACQVGLTFETPMLRSWNERIVMHRIAVTTVLAQAG
jgi:protein MpaA